MPLQEAIDAVISYGEDLPASHMLGVFSTLTQQMSAVSKKALNSNSLANKPAESDNYAKISEKVELSLDDIFKRTKKEPSLYYLPKKA